MGKNVTMKEWEGSEQDEAIDKRKGYKEGSKADNEADKKALKKINKKKETIDRFMARRDAEDRKKGR